MDAPVDMATDQVDIARHEWARERPTLTTWPMEVFARLGRVRALAERRVNGVLSEYGLSLASFDVLASLRRAGAPYRKTPTELATTSMLTTGGVTFRLDRLEAEGLIRRVASEQDRRVVYAELTDEGLARVDAAMAGHLSNELKMLAELDSEEVADLIRLLRRLETSIQKSEQDLAS